MNSNIDTPYSTCNAKGRCLRHPTIQLSRKKKLGGWKTLMSICPMCAMEIMKSGGDPNDYGLQLQVDNNNDHDHDDDHEEGRRLGREGVCSREMRRDPDSMSLHSHDRPAHRIGSGSGNSSSHHHRGPRSRPPSSSSKASRHHHQRYNNSDDRSTTGHSIHSAPSTFHRRDSQESGSSRGSSSREGSFKGCGGKGGGFNSSDSSCDTTVYSSDSSRRSHHSSSLSSSSHNNDGQCRRPMGVPMRGHHDTVVPQAAALRPRHTIIQQQQQDEDEYVCGMSYQGMKYTGQIHVETRVPHGLGTLRSGEGMIWEGTWHFGHLVDNSQTQEEEVFEEEIGLCEKLFDQYTTIQDAVSEDSSVSNSIAETIHDTLTEDEASYGSYTAQEAKVSSSSRGSNNVMMHDKMQEYSRYINHCDETQDYYYHQEDTTNTTTEDDTSDVSSISRSSSSQHYYPQKTRVSWNENLDDTRQTNNRRVRFCEDP